MQTIASELERISVLVVDDHADFRTVAATCFRNAGFSVLDAENVGQAIHMIGLGIVDVVLTDFSMPDGTGFELVEYVRAKKRDIPVFLMTVDSNLSARKVLERGGAGLFQKMSWSGPETVETIKNYLLVKSVL